MQRKKVSREARIERALSDYVVEDRGHDTPCWIFRARSGEYGAAYLGGDEQAIAHRLFYEAHIGPIPYGLVIDHLCRVKLCVNPKHLEPVTQRENCLRAVPYRETVFRPRIPSIPVGVRMSLGESEELEWLAKETSRTQSGAIKWAVAKVAKEMGYNPKK